MAENLKLTKWQQEMIDFIKSNDTIICMARGSGKNNLLKILKEIESKNKKPTISNWNFKNEYFCPFIKPEEGE